MEISKVPTTLRDREQSGPFKRRPRPKAGALAKESASVTAPATGDKTEHRVDVTA